jgi:hypothetical protein
MNYTRINQIGASALACLLIVACDDNINNEGSRDSTPSTSLPPASAPDNPANQPPLISGSAPNEATVGQQWSFQPNISDPDGDGLTVTASNLPGWIRIDERTGWLSGTPSDADVQNWSNITISVNDGSATTNLPVFEISVMAQNAAIGSVTLSWLAPTERVDGSPIGDLYGYRLLYGQGSGDYTQTVAINNPGITRYMIEGLTSGEWFFAIQAVDAGGLISAPSAEARTTI